MEIKNEADKALFMEMISAPDRSAVIVATSYLNDKLTDAIKVYLKKDNGVIRELFKATGPLGSLVNKANLGYLMGLYSKETLKDIRLAADMRNRFAHWTKQISFEHDEIRVMCEKITLPMRIHKTPPPGNFNESFYGVPPITKEQAKIRFINLIDFLSAHFIAMTKDPNHPKVL